MLKIARVTAFSVSELLRENQQRGEEGKITPKRLGLNVLNFTFIVFYYINLK